MNFTLNITASTEVISTLNRIAGVMEALLVSPPKTVIVDIIADTANLNNVQQNLQEPAGKPIQQAPQNTTYQTQSSSVQQIVPSQQQNQVPTNAVPVYNQPSSTPVNTVQAPIHTTPTQAVNVPTSPQTYTMEQLAVAATQLVDAGRRTELVGLLNSFGVQALTALPKEQYGAFAIQLRALGAKI